MGKIALRFAGTAADEVPKHTFRDLASNTEHTKCF